MSVYNYLTFPLDGDMEDFRRFPGAVSVGTQAPLPDQELMETPGGARVSLSEYYRRGVTVIEFGSFT